MIIVWFFDKIERERVKEEFVLEGNFVCINLFFMIVVILLFGIIIVF